MERAAEYVLEQGTGKGGERYGVGHEVGHVQVINLRPQDHCLTAANQYNFVLKRFLVFNREV